MMKKVNKEGPAVLHSQRLPQHLPFHRLGQVLDSDAPVIDTRPATAFAASHIPGTINIPHDGSFINWAGWLLAYDQPFYLIIDQHLVSTVAQDLAAIGLDNADGYFETAAVEAWAAAGHELQCYQFIAPSQAARQIAEGQAFLLDVRNRSEWDEGHIPQASHLMLGYLPDEAGTLPKDKPIITYCQTGARSAIGASILQAQGFPAVANLMGGMRDWSAAGLPVHDQAGATGR
jgi:hydroxyacylglutathione hydrolase